MIFGTNSVLKNSNTLGSRKKEVSLFVAKSKIKDLVSEFNPFV